MSAKALANILRNACRYGGPDKISFDVIEADEQLCFQIRDRGPGVDTNELDKLCDAFYRGGGKMHGVGHGLGLSIAQRAAIKQGGSMRLRNSNTGGFVVDWCLLWIDPAKHEK